MKTKPLKTANPCNSVSYTDLVSDWNKEHEYHGKSAAIFNDAGLLELTVYKGNNTSGAKNLFGLKVGENIFIEFE